MSHYSSSTAVAARRDERRGHSLLSPLLRQLQTNVLQPTLQQPKRVAQFATMWSLALAALAALVLSVDCECPEFFEPLNKTMRRLEFNGSRSWHEVTSMCSKQFPGRFEMLHRDFLGLSEADRALCRGQVVPLGLFKIGPEPIVWRKGYLPHEEEVNSTYLARKRGAETLNETAHVQVGSLDLTTNQWRLVDSDTSFTCAICQRAWLDSLDRLDGGLPLRPAALNNAWTFRLVETDSDDVTVDEALRLAVDNLKHEVDRRNLNGIWAEFEKLNSSDPGGDDSNRGTSVRVRSSYGRLKADDVTKALNGSYAVESWWDADFCPPTRYHGMDWEETFRSWVRYARMPEFHVASRQCGTRMRGENGDLDAAWDEDIFLWIDHGDKCKSRQHLLNNS